MPENLTHLLAAVRACRVCEGKIPEPRPVLNAHRDARVLIVGQAPGRKVHETGIPWNDPSGDRLRSWLDMDKSTFYNPHCWFKRNPWLENEVTPALRRHPAMRAILRTLH